MIDVNKLLVTDSEAEDKVSKLYKYSWMLDQVQRAKVAERFIVSLKKVLDEWYERPQALLDIEAEMKRCAQEYLTSLCECRQDEFGPGRRNNCVTDLVILCAFIDLDWNEVFQENVRTNITARDWDPACEKFDSVNWDYYVNSWKRHGRTILLEYLKDPTEELTDLLNEERLFLNTHKDVQFLERMKDELEGDYINFNSIFYRYNMQCVSSFLEMHPELETKLDDYNVSNW